MYFPYLRGRQYELIALRELVLNHRLGQYIIPIIEPVKLSSTFIKTLKLFIKNEKSVAVIHNPQVGSFSKELEDEKNYSVRAEYEELLKNNFIIKAHIINPNSHSQLAKLTSIGFNKKDLLVICDKSDYIDLYLDEFYSNIPLYTLIPDERGFRRSIKRRRVLLDDKFEKQERNMDYADLDEPFSDDHLYYKDDEFIGFSDYSIVGNNFLEAGFAPYAVALHIVYLSSDSRLRIRHFVSDSNEDITNPAGKFYEALRKLYLWDESHEMDTLGLSELLKHFENETYPGLGVAKKLSMMHHIELVSQYLNEVE